MTLPNGSPQLAAEVYARCGPALAQRVPAPPHQLQTQLQTLWLPLAQHLIDLRHQRQRPIVQGILGGQGTGKSSLGAVLTLLLSDAHVVAALQGEAGPEAGPDTSDNPEALPSYPAVSLSLDDLYKTYAERQNIPDPRLIWRGPPGTHDVGLGLVTLDALRQGQPVVSLPRFDKSLHQGMGDRTTPEVVRQVEIVLFEGWFVGVQPIAESAFDAAPWPITTAADVAFARDMNQSLRQYLPLWERLDSLLILYAEDYRYSKRWRQQAEQRMQAQGKFGMGDRQIEEFVEYFWKALHPELFIRPLIAQSPPGMAIAIDLAHQPILPG
jgi:D-glycerate 3-kinase